jgi:hypothetical protein
MSTCWLPPPTRIFAFTERNGLKIKTKTQIILENG